MAENIDKLFESIQSDILTEEVKLEMVCLYENALNESIKAKEEELEAKNKLDQEALTEAMVTKINDYLDAFVEEFTTNNVSKIDESVKVKTAERVLKAFDKLVAEFNIQLDEKVETDETALTEAITKINKLENDLITAKKETKMREKAAIVTEAASHFETDMQKAKLLEYAKKLPFDELFEKKLNAFAKVTITEAKKPFSKETKVEKLVIVEEKEAPPVLDEKKDITSKYNW